MDKTKTTKTSSTRSKTIVNIPVTVSLLIPVEIDHDIGEMGEEDDLLGKPILEIGEREDGAEILDKTIEAMKASDLPEEALICLLAGANEFKKNHPSIEGRYSIFLGIANEEKI